MITLVYAGTSDGFVQSADNSYSTALNGGGTFPLDTTGTTLSVGQFKDGDRYRIYQSFVEFAYTAASGAVPVSAEMVLTGTGTSGTAVNRRIDYKVFDWGGTITDADFRTPSQLNNLQIAAYVQRVQNVGTGRKMFAGFRFISLLDSSSTLRYVLHSDRNRLEQTPSGEERNLFSSSDASGTDNDPYLLTATVTENLLNRTLGSQCQLSDGTHFYVEIDEVSGGTYNINLWHHDGTTPTLVDTFLHDDSSYDFRGAQSFAITRDSDDNVYMFQPFSSDSNRIYCRAWIKGSGYSWTRGPGQTASLPDDDAQAWITNLRAAWHPVGPGGGTILVLGFRRSGWETDGCQDPYLLMSPLALKNGTGGLVRASGRAGDVKLINWPAHQGWLSTLNHTGTLMDICANPTSSNPGRGFVISSERNALMGENASQSIAAYQINSNGNGFTSVVSQMATGTGFAVKDPDAKSRVLGISDTQFATVTVDGNTGTGITIRHRQNFVGSSSIDSLSVALMDTEGIASLPDASALSTSSAWDAFFNPTDNSVWIYYFDVADDSRLMRTRVDLSTGLADRNEIEVNATVGASGSVNHSIRVHRGPTVSPKILITVANETSGGVHSLIYITDRVNAVPTQPLVDTLQNYDATDDATLTWSFQDPDADDSQTAYELEIDNITDGTSAVQTGEVTSSNEFYLVTGSTLPNNKDYRWRVRTWDIGDAVSPWSNYSFFSTSNTGIISITDPAIDNDPMIFTEDYLLQWSVINATPDSYHLVATDTGDGSTLVDTGWVTSTNDYHLITGMLSDHEYRIEVTARQSMVESNTAVRYITPDYDTPEIPLPTITVVDVGAYILISVANPEARGDRPEPDYNDIYRRVAGSESRFEFLGTIIPNSSFQDYTAASGTVYEYFARAGAL